MSEHIIREVIARFAKEIGQALGTEWTYRTSTWREELVRADGLVLRFDQGSYEHEGKLSVSGAYDGQDLTEHGHILRIYMSPKRAIGALAGDIERRLISQAAVAMRHQMAINQKRNKTHQIYDALLTPLREFVGTERTQSAFPGMFRIPLNDTTMIRVDAVVDEKGITAPSINIDLRHISAEMARRILQTALDIPDPTPVS